MREMKEGAQKGFVALVTACAVLVPLAVQSSAGPDLVTATNWDGAVGLVLENGMRIRARGQPLHADLQVDFVCRDGKWESRAWAWFDRMPALEHKVSLDRVDGDAETLTLDFVVEFRSHAPVFAGGTGRYTVELRRALGVIRGDFTGRLDPLTTDVSTNLWTVYRGYTLGATQKPDWSMGVDPGRVCSLGRAGATVRASVVPAPLTVCRQEPAAKGEHPRLFTRPGERGTFSDRFVTGRCAAVTANITKVLEQRRGGWLCCAGSEAAGRAMLSYIRHDAEMAKTSAACARDALAAMRENPHSMAYGRNLAGVALAYDLCAPEWPEDFRGSVCTELATAALRLSACLPQVTKADALLAPGQLLDRVSSSCDYRLGYIRATAGLALMAVEGDNGCGAPPERLAEAEVTIARSVGRLLGGGIGEHGEGTGNSGYADLIEVVFPYLQAYRFVRGRDLASGTGAEWVGVLGVATRGACFQRGSGYQSGAWIPFVLPFADADFTRAVRTFAVRTECRFDDPWHGVFAALNLPQTLDVSAQTGALPVILEDRAMGSYTLGGGNGERFVYFRGGAGSDLAGAMRGDVCLYAFGREWMASHAGAAGEFVWPRAGEFNTINLTHESKSGQNVGIVPRSAGYIERIRFDRVSGLSDGSGSVCMRADNEGASHGTDVFGLEGGGSIGGAAWRTVGVDFSQASGAEVLLVIVEGCLAGSVDTDRYWEMDAGAVPPECVATGPGTFVVRPSGASVSMQGVFIYPETVDVAYTRPDERRGGRIRALLNRKAPNRDLSSESAIQAKASGATEDADLRTVVEVKGDEAIERSRQTRAATLVRAIRGESYGPGGADQRAANTCVVVLTVQQGEPPRIEPAGASDGYLVKVGGQTVYYEDSSIMFGHKR